MPRRLRLTDEARPGRRLAPEDLGQLRFTLSQLGVFDPARERADTESLMTPGLQRAVRTLQAGNGLREDAVLKPRGPTEKLLNNLRDHGRGLRTPVQGDSRSQAGRAAREDTPGALAGRVGPGLENHPDDVNTVGTALRTLGHIKPKAPIPAKTGAVLDGLKSFQSANGLKRDGIIAPDGPTERQLALSLAANAPRGHGTRGSLSVESLEAGSAGDPEDGARPRKERQRQEPNIGGGSVSPPSLLSQSPDPGDVGAVYDEDFQITQPPFTSGRSGDLTNYRVGRGMLTEFHWRPDTSNPGSFVKIDPGTGRIVRGRSGQPITSNESALAPTDLPDELIAELDLLKRQWGINPELPGAADSNTLGVLQGRVRTMSREERRDLVARTFQLERLDPNNVSLAQTLRLRIRSAQAEPFHGSGSSPTKSSWIS